MFSYLIFLLWIVWFCCRVTFTRKRFRGLSTKRSAVRWPRWGSSAIYCDIILSTYFNSLNDKTIFLFYSNNFFHTYYVYSFVCCFVFNIHRNNIPSRIIDVLVREKKYWVYLSHLAVHSFQNHSLITMKKMSATNQWKRYTYSYIPKRRGPEFAETSPLSSHEGQMIIVYLRVDRCLLMAVNGWLYFVFPPQPHSF